jgi:predicted Zn-ribbon and HTH transcriptional regulator
MLVARFRNKVIEAIRDFNKYRSPEATAKLLKFDKKEFVVDFSGTFCRTCGFYDYFDDLKIFLEEKGVKSKVSKIEEKENGAIVIFSL